VGYLLPEVLKQVQHDGTLNLQKDFVMKEPCIYILTNKPLGTLYIGVSSNLIQRIAQHQQGTFKSFSHKYNLKKLVYYE